jgi:hypothetical protein
LLQNKSVKTGKTLVDVAHENGTEVKHPEKGVGRTPNVKVQTGGSKKVKVVAAKKTAGKTKAAVKKKSRA